MNVLRAPKIYPYFRRRGRRQVQEGFRVDWYEGGRRQRKKVATREAAELLAGEKGRAFALQHTGLNLVPTRLTAAHLPYVEQALAILEKHNFVQIARPETTAQLVKAVDWFVEHYREPRANLPTVEKFIAVFLQAKLKKAAETHRDYRKNLQPFLEAGYGGHRLDEVTTAMIAEFLDGRPVGPTTKAKYFGALRALFYFAMEKSEKVDPPWLEHNPVADLSTPPKASVPRRLRYTLPEVKDLIQVAIYLRCAPLLILRLYTMLRTEEAARFIRGPVPAQHRRGRPRAYNPWAHIDLGQCQLSYHEDDSAKDSRDITLHPVMVAWLTFFREHRIPLELTRRLEAARRIAVPAKYGAGSENLIRHTAISFRATFCGSVLEAAIEADNSENVIKKHYFRKVSPADAAEFHALTPDKFDLRPYLDPHFAPSGAELRALEKRYRGIGRELEIRRRQRGRGREQFKELAE